MTKARRLGARPAEAQDEILIQGIRIPCALGVTATERKMRRPVLVDLELGLDLERAGITDRLSDTVDYGAVYQVVEEVANQRDYRLVESLCEEIIEAIFDAFPVDEIQITARKFAPLAGSVEHTGVRLRRYRSV
ncbi:MAG: dihydroneopterin aldolase [bacterium TMED88]|nr:dihydroneopterin aldolase [Deltaproteobacteria bacterium]OUV37001.1 MAG: dihydroneopterin aldolase [bacterium TMED88]